MDLATNRAGITDLIDDAAPELVQLTGVGAVVAAAVMIAWPHPGRVRSEAALKALHKAAVRRRLRGAPWCAKIPGWWRLRSADGRWMLMGSVVVDPGYTLVPVSL